MNPLIESRLSHTRRHFLRQSGFGAAALGSLLAGLPLDDRDIVYFSEYVDQPGAPYGVVAEEEGIVSLDGPAREAQRMEIAAALTPHSAGGPRTGVYDIREFTY